MSKRNDILKGIKAVILAGGKGTRLYPITKEIPKPLLPVGRKPIINHLVDLFFSHDLKEIAVLIGRDFAQEFFWWKKRYYPRSSIQFFEEEKPLGTFGGLALLREWLGASPFFLTNGDELKEVHLGEMALFHTKAKSIGTIALVEVENPQHYGVVLCKGERVQEFVEKPADPKSNYINSGLYLLNPDIFKHHKGLFFSMIEKDIFPKLAKEKKLSAFKGTKKWADCGTWERYEKALREWA